MAAMSVIGIDFGNESCYIAVARAGGIETIANDYSLRATPSCVAFGGKNRILGVAAKNQVAMNMKNTVFGFKRLLGRYFDDPFAQKEMALLPFKTSKLPNGKIGIHVQYLGEEQVFTVEQLTAMLFTKLKEIAEADLGTAVNDCVISVPSYYSQGERQSLLDAARIAGLNILRLFNETTATALSYGIYKQDLPSQDAPPRNVAFVDCGYASLQVSICEFQKGKLRMISSAGDPHLGSREIDYMLADHFCKDFQTRYKINAKNNPRAYARLLTEVEKLKKQMSANSTMLPLNIECFMEEKDVQGAMKRADMEAMGSHIFQKMESVMKRCLADSKLKLDDIYAVEVVGGASRVPAIKQMIERVFAKPVSTTLNQDEAVSRGCALQCAMLSPAVRIRDFAVTDIQPYPIKLTYDPSQGEDGEMAVFPHNHPVPFSKMLTFFRSGSFELSASYISPPPSWPQSHIGSFIVQNVKSSPDGESVKVKVKVRLNLNGIFTIASASLIEKREPNQQEKEEEQLAKEKAAEAMNVDQLQYDQDKLDQEAQEKEPPAPEVNVDKRRRSSGNGASGGDDQDKRASASYSSRILSWFSSGDDKEDGGKGKKKSSLRTVDLPIESRTLGFTQKDLDAAIERECKMKAEDRQEKERIDARNALEEYVYDLRAKLNDDDQLASYVTEGDRESIGRVLDDTENWLYEDGEDCQRQVYSDRLTGLKSQGEPIKERRIEFEGGKYAIEDMAHALQLAKKGLDQILTCKDDKYNHITDEELKKVENLIVDKSCWLDGKRAALNKTPLTQQAPVTVAEIRAEKQSLDSSIIPILNKPKPKMETKEEKKEKNVEQEPCNQNEAQNNQQPTTESKMDVE